MDNNHSPQELLNFWKKGKTFNEALYKFTDLKIWQEYDSILNSKVHHENMKPSETEMKNISTAILNGLATYHRATEYSKNINDILDKLKSNLLEKIRSEKLIGLGYQSPVKISDFPQMIPLHIWPRYINEINWDDCSLIKEENKIENIRLIKLNSKKSELNKIIEPPKVLVKDKKIGRPSIKSKIIAAYDFLKESNKIDYSKTLKAHTELIQKTVQILFPEIKTIRGMEYEAIRRSIGIAFQEDKTSKPTSKL